MTIQDLYDLGFMNGELEQFGIVNSDNPSLVLGWTREQIDTLVRLAAEAFVKGQKHAASTTIIDLRTRFDI